MQTNKQKVILDEMIEDQKERTKGTQQVSLPVARMYISILIIFIRLFIKQTLTFYKLKTIKAQ